MKRDALIGVDVGTTNVKAAAYDLDGHALASESRRLDVLVPRPNWAEYDPQTLWETTADVVRSVARQLEGVAVPRALAVSSMAETAIPLGGDLAPVYNAIAWFDGRTQAQAEWLLERISADDIFSITGLSIQPIFGLNKLLWIKQNLPENYAGLRHWLNVADYVAFKLSGEQATDLSLASRMMALDLAAGEWSDEILSAADVAANILATPVPSGRRLGRVLPDIAVDLGLPDDTTIVTGGHDHPCAALGSGVIAPGIVLDSLGTSETLLMVTPRPVLRREIARLGFQQGAHVVPGRYVCSGGLYTAGACVDWLRSVLVPDQQPVEAYAAIEDLASDRPAGNNGVFFLPYLRMAGAPHSDPLARASFVGVTAATTRGDLARAVLEGMAFESHQSLIELERAFEVTAGRIRAVGGPARNKLYMRIRAALARDTVSTLTTVESATLGAARLAGLGANLYPSLDDAVAASPPEEEVVAAEDTERAIYADLFENVYRDIYTATAPFNPRLEDRFPAR